MTDTQTNDTDALANLLHERLVAWEQARKPQELKLLDCYADVMRIARDDDTAGTATARSKKAKSLFIGSTRNKVRATRAKIIDALFGNGRLPFDIQATNEELAPMAEVVKDIVTEQLERGDFRTLLSDGVDLLATYGTGFMFGPLVRKETHTKTRPDGMGGIDEQTIEFDLPHFKLASTLDIYPDPEARNVDEGLGVFWVTMESPHTVSAWASDKAYSNVADALKSPEGNHTENGSDRATQLRANVEYWHQNNRIKVARFFGKVPRSKLTGPVEAEDADTAKLDEMVDVIAIMAGGVVVKVDEAPWKCNPARRCVYEAVPNEIWGVGVAENNAPHQKTVNAAFRLFMEGKGMALLGTKAVDRANFLPTENFQKYPGKVYQFKPNLSPDEKKASIIEFTEPDITDGWLDVIRASEQFSDDDTGITKYTQGDDSGNLNKTASGISMIMSASSMPTKEVIQHIDSMWTEPAVKGVIEWNLKYLDPETVRLIHGDKHADIWAKIKELGSTAFLDWYAVGTKSFMAKEVLANKLMQYATFVLGNPNAASRIDIDDVLEQYWDVLEMGRESPLIKDDDNAKIPPQVQQHMQQMEDTVKHLSHTMDKMAAELEGKDIERFKAETERLNVEGNLALKAQAQAATPDVLLTEFEAIKAMLLDVMQGVKNPEHLAALPPPPSEPPPEPAPPAPPQQPAPDAGFSLSGQGTPQ